MIRVDDSHALCAPYSCEECLLQWDSITEYTQSFFTACKEWFDHNGVWLWPVTIVLAGIASLVMTCIFSCVFCQESCVFVEQLDEDSQTSHLRSVPSKDLLRAVESALKNQPDAPPTEEQLIKIQYLTMCVDQQQNVTEVIEITTPATNQEAEELIARLENFLLH